MIIYFHDAMNYRYKIVRFRFEDLYDLFFRLEDPAFLSTFYAHTRKFHSVKLYLKSFRKTENEMPYICLGVANLTNITPSSTPSTHKLTKPPPGVQNPVENLRIFTRWLNSCKVNP